MVKKKKSVQLNGEQKIHLKKMGDITWRIFRIMSEFVEGFQFLSQFRQEVSIFGSARLNPNHKFYKKAEKLGALLAKEGYTVITGGGPGIMQAANKGAYKINPSKSVGINIQLPQEQRINKYVSKGIAFHYFFTRKVMLAASSQVYIFFPGGFGTMDEFLEMLELVQTNKIQKTSILLIGKEFWTPLIEWFKNTMLNKYKTISTKDMNLFNVVDSTEEVMKIVRKSKERTIF